jgi:hypothetical protein
MLDWGRAEVLLEVKLLGAVAVKEAEQLGLPAEFRAGPSSSG